MLEAYPRLDHRLPAPLRIGSAERYESTVLTGVLPDDVRIDVDLEWEPGTREISILLRTDAEGENGYVLRLEPALRRMVLDRWPRPVHGAEQWHVSGDVPHFVELERPVDLTGRRAHIDLLLKDELLQCCVNQSVCLTTSVYDHPAGRAGLAALDGAVTCTRLDTLLTS